MKPKESLEFTLIVNIFYQWNKKKVENSVE